MFYGEHEASAWSKDNSSHLTGPQGASCFGGRQPWCLQGFEALVTSLQPKPPHARLVKAQEQELTRCPNTQGPLCSCWLQQLLSPEVSQTQPLPSKAWSKCHKQEKHGHAGGGEGRFRDPHCPPGRSPHQPQAATEHTTCGQSELRCSVPNTRQISKTGYENEDGT